MTSVGADTVDLVCGPDGPLPEGRQRYRLTGRLGSGGQADVFRGVRLSSGVRSAPVTVKVFREDHRRPVLDQMRSWDKGDAVLMDLNTRDVPGICLRVDGFYGAPPVAANATSVLGSSTDRRIPYQVLDYLPGHTLLQHVAKQAGGEAVPRLDGPAVLTTLARTIALLHRPADRGDTPVLHMDVKPANVLVLPSGEIRLIDFTAARYHDPQHITTIAHTPESAGPEAFTGVVGPSYDVHGFGSVAYHLVTGWLPRADRATSHYDGALVAPGALRRHPLLDANPALAAHLLAPLDDNPGNRPLSSELVNWVSTLARLASAVPAASTHVDWVAGAAAGPTPTRVERIPPQAPSAPAARASAPIRGAAKVGTAAVGGAAAAAPYAAAAPASGGPAYGSVYGAPAAGPAAYGAQAPRPPAPSAPSSGGPAYGASRPNPTAPLPDIAAVNAPRSGPPKTTAMPRYSDANEPQSGPPAGPKIRSGVAKVGPRQPGVDDVDNSRRRRDDGHDQHGGGQAAPAQQQPAGPLRRSGKKYTTFATVVAAAGWLLWLATVAIISGADTGEPITAAILVVVAAFAVWWLVRLGGHLIRSTLERGARRSTFVQNAVTGTFILLCGLFFATRGVSNFSDVGAMISEWWSNLWDSIWPF
ncbi:protein kinase domain-containing protein [Cryptosporangium japonicum]|uniref:Protein kinase domain-containing protein n=1 Tax=Cryptosporangium japonicum TaxID=80872 RepID=A0ABN0UMG4_9ACTN